MLSALKSREQAQRHEQQRPEAGVPPIAFAQEAQLQLQCDTPTSSTLKNNERQPCVETIPSTRAKATPSDPPILAGVRQHLLAAPQEEVPDLQPINLLPTVCHRSESETGVPEQLRTLFFLLHHTPL